MHNKLRIGLFLALLLLPFAVFAQEDDTNEPTGNLVYSVFTPDVDTALTLYSIDDETTSRISPEGVGRNDVLPIFSPDGGRIAFLADGMLSFIGANGEGLLTTSIENPLYLSWASDNSRVMFLAETDDIYTINIYSVDTEENRVYESDLLISIESTPSWSADGTTIFFAAREDINTNNDIYTLSADFETLTNLTNSPTTAEHSPSVSPNGMFISYKVSASNGPLAYVMVMNIDGTDVRQLTDFKLPLGSLTSVHMWSPDSSRVMIEDAGQGIAIINVITGSIVEFEGINAVWSPDARWVAYTRPQPNSKGVLAYQIWIAQSNFASEGTIVVSGVVGKIAWQPDPSIEFETVEIPSPTPSATDTPSAPQSVVESVLVEGQQSSWYFDGDANLAVTIIAQSDAFDTIAQLYTLDGTLLIENDDFDGTNSQIDFTLPNEAVYQVVITSFYGDASGDYTLTVIGIEEGDLREKPQGGDIATPTATATPSPTFTPTATLRPTSTHTPTATFTPTITPSPTFGFDRAQCPANLPPRLAIDTRGRVLPGGTSAVYDQPIANSTVLGEIPGGVSFTVLDGPVCTEGFIWWQVEYRDITGWTIEAGAGEYFLEPLRR
ncbi:MAG: hypothetical protein SFZ02_08780 [bacterium]|nr:hypothetical protein [bacterium]